MEHPAEAALRSWAASQQSEQDGADRRHSAQDRESGESIEAFSYAATPPIPASLKAHQPWPANQRSSSNFFAALRRKVASPNPQVSKGKASATVPSTSDSGMSPNEFYARYHGLSTPSSKRATASPPRVEERVETGRPWQYTGLPEIPITEPISLREGSSSRRNSAGSTHRVSETRSIGRGRGRSGSASYISLDRSRNDIGASPGTPSGSRPYFFPTARRKSRDSAATPPAEGRPHRQHHTISTSSAHSTATSTASRLTGLGLFGPSLDGLPSASSEGTSFSAKAAILQRTSTPKLREEEDPHPDFENLAHLEPIPGPESRPKVTPVHEYLWARPSVPTERKPGGVFEENAVFFPPTDVLHARRAVSPTYIDGPISSVQPPEHAWRSSGLEHLWQRPQIGVGLPTSYTHERPVPEFTRREEIPALPKVMRPDYRNDQSPPSSSPRERWKDVSHFPNPFARAVAPASTNLSRTSSRVHEFPSYGSVATTASIEHGLPASISDERSVETAATSIMPSRSGIAKSDHPSHDTNTVPSVSFSPETYTRPLPPSRTASGPSAYSRDWLRPGSSAPGAGAGTSRAPLLSPIMGSSPGNTADSRSPSDIGQSPEDTYQLMQRLHLDEARLHSIDVSGFLEPVSGCESIFLPKPRLRSQSLEQYGWQRATAGTVGIPARHRPRRSSFIAPDQEDIEHLAEASDLPHSVATSLRARNSGPRHGAQHSIGSVARSEPYHATVRDQEEGSHAQPSSSAAGYDSDSGIVGSRRRPFFHHRMPPTPPIPDLQGGGVGRGEGHRARHSLQPSASLLATGAERPPPTPALTHHETDDEADDNLDEDLDVATVLEQGRRLEYEREQWRQIYQRSIDSGYTLSSLGRRNKAARRQGKASNRSEDYSVPSGTAPLSLRRLFDGYERDAMAPPKETVWTDERTGRIYLVTELDRPGQDTRESRRLRQSKSSPQLRDYVAQQSDRDSPEPVIPFCQPMAWCARPGLKSKKSSRASLRQAARAQENVPESEKVQPRRRSHSMHAKSERRIKAESQRESMPVRYPAMPSEPPRSILQRPGSGHKTLLDRAIVSDEPFVIGRYNFPTVPKRVDTGTSSLPGSESGKPTSSSRTSASVSKAAQESLEKDESSDRRHRPGGSATPSQVGVAISTPVKDPTGLALPEEDDTVPPGHDDGQHPSMPAGRYPTRGYHRPSNSGEIRDQLRRSRSSLQSHRDGSAASPRSDGGKSMSPKKTPRGPLPPLPTSAPSEATGAAQTQAAQSRSQRVSSGRLSAESVPGDSIITFHPTGPSESLSLPVPPRKTRSLASLGRPREDSGASYPYPISVGASSNESMAHPTHVSEELQQDDDVNGDDDEEEEEEEGPKAGEQESASFQTPMMPGSVPFQTPMMEPTEEELFRFHQMSGATPTMSGGSPEHRRSPRLREESYSSQLTDRARRYVVNSPAVSIHSMEALTGSATPQFAPWRDSYTSSYGDEQELEPTVGVGESPQREPMDGDFELDHHQPGDGRFSYMGSTDDSLGSTRASSDAPERPEIWDANNVSVENLFFRPPQA